MDHAQMQILEEKLQNLLNRYKRLQKENESLKDELHIAKRDLALSKNAVAELQQKIDVQHLGVQNWTDEQKETLNKRIDIYLKEIEQSLTLLNG